EHSAPLAPPGPHEVQITQSAVGLDFIDCYHRSGLYPLGSMPHGIGLEAAGVITACGAAVDPTQLGVGERVVYLSRPPGAYASARNVLAEHCVLLPRGVSEEVAAASMLKGLTAEYLAHRVVPLEPGMRALVHAAAGGTGSLLCQWLTARGVEVIGTVGSESKVDVARGHGCAEVLVDGDGERPLPERVRTTGSGGGVHVVYDSIGLRTFQASLACLARRGMLVSFGNASGPPAPLDVLSLSTNGSLFLTRPTLFDYVATRAELVAASERLFDAIERGVLKVPIHQRWPLRAAREAHRALEARETTGASVLIP
ncbi:MAG: quinone oxidoreductase, partial [Myxococcales bacterium]|nr:quinone oxidoreductase [Myxococcales bacterium]